MKGSNLNIFKVMGNKVDIGILIFFSLIGLFVSLFLNHFSSGTLSPMKNDLKPGSILSPHCGDILSLPTVEKECKSSFSCGQRPHENDFFNRVTSDRAIGITFSSGLSPDEKLSKGGCNEVEKVNKIDHFSIPSLSGPSLPIGENTQYEDNTEGNHFLSGTLCPIKSLFSCGLCPHENNNFLYVYYSSLLFIFIWLISLNIFMSILMMLIGFIFGEKIQNKDWNYNEIKNELVYSIFSFYVIAGLFVWPYIMTYYYDKDIALTYDLNVVTYGIWNFNKILGFTFLFVQSIIIWIFADAWTYLKHYLLHSRRLFRFHKNHHYFHNPTSFAAFTISPLEALWTFFPSILFCFPNIIGKLYTPLHVGTISFFFILNVYLHCGYTLKYAEYILSYFYINTSSWHNVHHEKTILNFGEVSPYWDFILGTYDKDIYKKRGLYCVY